MPGGVLSYQSDYISRDLRSYLSQFEYRIATLECALGCNEGPFDPIKMKDDGKQNIVFVREEDLNRLSELGINIVSLANNHAMDCGIEGMFNMIHSLRSRNIIPIGAGATIEEAKRPAVISYQGKSVAIIAFQLNMPKPWCFYPASLSSPGIFYVEIDKLCNYISELKQRYDYVVAMPHWGEEHQYMPLEQCVIYSQQMIRSGVDLIIGSHPHIINPVVNFDSKSVYFSLGNFLFPEKCMQVPRPMYYPKTKEECLSLKRVWTYPKRIKEPVVAVWKPKNRIGMMVEMNVGTQLETRYNLTCLSSDNVVHHYHSLIVRIRMCFWAFLVKLPKYGLVRSLYYHRYNFLRRAIDKMPAFNIPVEL